MPRPSKNRTFCAHKFHRIRRHVILTALFRRIVQTPCLRPPVTPHLPSLSDFQVALAELAQLRDAHAIAPFANSHNGYLRQAAITHCAGLNVPAMLPLVVGRLNDWVEQVRDAARAAVIALAPVCSASDLLAALPHILQLHDARRTEHAAWITSYQDMLRTRPRRPCCRRAHWTGATQPAAIIRHRGQG